jgi:Spy/CpxP family protein refolding chaperone
MKKIAFLVIAASGALSALPASAQVWRIQPRAQQEIRGDIDQLQNQIQRAQQRRTISAREAVGLRQQAASLRQTYARYNRNGLDRNEVRTLQNQVNTLRQRLRLERRDWDGRRG